MKGTTATKAKNRFGELLDMSIAEPVAIEKKGRPVAVLLSFEEYQRLSELDDRYWGEKAQEALKSGFLSVKDTAKWLNRKLNAEAPTD